MTSQRADTTAREQRHAHCAAVLEGASDDELLELVASPRMLELGYAPVRLPRGGDTVFAKLVPMTALELAPENRGATANLFGLPVRYQYRIGTCGFGGWRELEVHQLANQWVLSGECASFPLLHHARILPLVKTGYDDRRELAPWGDCPSIHRRVAAVTAATSSLVLFLEHLPLTLGEWLRDQMGRASDPVAVIRRIENELRGLLAFLGERELLHMDVHLDNVLTDGHQLYLADFGLAISRGFELGPDEQTFFEHHRDFDLWTAINTLVHAVVTYYDPRDDWRQTVRAWVASPDGPPQAVRAWVLRRAPMILASGEYVARFVADTTTPFPAAELSRLLSACLGTPSSG